MLRKVLTARSGVSAPLYIWRTVPIGSAACGYWAARGMLADSAMSTTVVGPFVLGVIGRTLGTAESTHQRHSIITGRQENRQIAARWRSIGRRRRQGDRHALLRRPTTNAWGCSPRGTAAVRSAAKSLRHRCRG